jgi:hypothetical protein
MGDEHKMTVDAPMYVYATEMVAAYYERLNLPGKRVLAISGSGDQVLNAMYFGAIEVVGFDINRNSLFMTELKIAAVLALTYQEFLRYFAQTKKGFSRESYVKMRPKLSKTCQRYFDRLYDKVGSEGLGISDFFRHRGDLIDRKKAQEINGYLADSVAYGKMGIILEEARPVLLVKNVLHLGDDEKFLGEKFDVINLSNVPNYLTGKSFGLSEEDVLSYFQKLKGIVSKDGVIFFYSYDNAVYPNAISPRIPPISRVSFLKKIRQSGAFMVSRKSFPGLVDGNRDRITVLR